MAIAVRMTASSESALSSPALVINGAFGQRVASLLAAGQARDQVAPGGADAAAIAAAFAGAAGAVVAVLSGPDADVCERADQLAFGCGKAWLPIVMAPPKVVRIGPLVCPPLGPCATCANRRRQQHDDLEGVSAAAEAVDQPSVSSGPDGFLPHHARLAAAIARGMLSALGSGAPGEQNVYLSTQFTIRMSSSAVSTARVVSCHDCCRCRAGSPSRSARDYRPLLSRTATIRRVLATEAAR